MGSYLKMQKTLLFIALILLNCFSAHNISGTKAQNAKDFITGFFTTLNGDFTFDEKCLGEKTAEDIHKMIDAFTHAKVMDLVIYAREVMNITEDSCPIEETKSYMRTKALAIKEGYYFTNFRKNILEIGDIALQEFNNKDRTAYSIGVACAKIEKMTIYKNMKQLAFLSLGETPDFIDVDIDLEGFKKFLKGLFTGVSSVPFEDNVCYTSTINIDINEVKALFERLYKSIKEHSPSNFYHAVVEIIALLKRIKNAKAACNISGLVKSLGVYATPYVGIGKLIYNVAMNYSVYYDDIMDAYHGFSGADWEDAGLATGKIASTLLSWKTS